MASGGKRSGAGRKKDRTREKIAEYAIALEKKHPAWHRSKILERVGARFPNLPFKLSAGALRELIRRNKKPVKNISLEMSHRAVGWRIALHEAGRRIPSATPIGFQRVFTSPTGRRIVFEFNEPTLKPKKGWGDDLEPGRNAKDVLRMFRRYGAGWKLTRIAREAYANGVRGARGANIGPDGVLDILANPIYMGTLAPGRNSNGRFNRVTEYVGPSGALGLMPHRDAVPAIVPADLWRRVNDKINASPKKPRKRPEKGKYPLQGVLFCGHCRRPMRGFEDAGSKQTDKRGYMCPTNYGKPIAHGNGGVSLTVPAHRLEDFAMSVLIANGGLAEPCERKRLGEHLRQHGANLEIVASLIPHKHDGHETTLISGRMQLRGSKPVAISALDVNELRWLDAVRFVLVEFARTRAPVRLVTVSRFLYPGKRDNQADRLLAVGEATGFIVRVPFKGYVPAAHS